MVLAGILRRFSYRPSGGTSILPEQIAADISKLEIKMPAKSIELAKSEGIWRLEKPFVWKADAGAVKNFCKKLTGAVLSEPLSDNPAVYEIFELNESSAAKISVYVLLKEKPHIVFHSGKRGTEPESVYLRVEDSNNVYQASGISNYDFSKDLNEWLDKTVLSVNRENIKSISVKSTRLNFKIKQSSAVWMFENRALPWDKTASLINPMLDSLARLEADGIIPAMDFTEKTRRELKILINLSDGNTIEMEVMEGADKNLRFLKLAIEKDFIFRMFEWKLSPFRKTKKDFL